VIYAILLLLIAAAGALAFNRWLPTRAIGFGAAGASLLAAGLLVAEQYGDLLPTLPPLTWAVVDEFTITIAPQAGPLGLLLGFTLLAGSALAQLELALALAPTVRGFGRLFAWVLLVQAAALLTTGGEGLIVPLLWALVVLPGYAAVRASGALNRSEGLPLSIAMGLLASLLLLAGLLGAAPALADGVPPGTLSVGCIILASVMLVGGTPFHHALDEVAEAPGALGGLLYGLALPVIGLGTLTSFLNRLHAANPDLPLPALQQALLLLLGITSLLACAGGALREYNLRRMLGWLVGTQAGLVLLALGLDGALARLAAPALLLNLMLTILTGALAVAVLERLTGSADYTDLQTNTSLWLPGLLWALAAASALGIPGLWGFWGRLWLFDVTLDQAPWLLPPTLAASVLLALACLAPLARFWREPGEGTRPTMGPFLLVLLLGALPLPLLGLLPQLAWMGGLNQIADVPAQLPVSITTQAGSVGVVVVAALLVLLLRRRSERPALNDEDMTPTVLAPTALGNSLAPLAHVGRPEPLGQRLWSGLLLLGRLAQNGIWLFEKRFYLAGVLVALVSLILLMAQG
jgi:NADH-quinone oxidoreductase subunit M